jgi:hypothetical protein
MPGKFDLVLQKAEQALASGIEKDRVEEQVLAYLAQEGVGNFRSLEEVERANIQGVEETDTGWKGLGRAAIQGATFGLGDELRGIGAALVPGGEGYKEAQQRSLGRVEEVRRQRPVASTVAELAGSLPTSLALTRGASMIAPIGRGLRSTRALPRMNLLSKGGPAPTLGRAGTMGLLGAAEGAVYGAGSAESGDRLGGAIKGAAIGAPLGGAAGLLPGASHAVRRTAQGARAPAHAAEAIDVARRGGAEGLPARTSGSFSPIEEARAASEAARTGSKVVTDVPETLPTQPGFLRRFFESGDDSLKPLRNREATQRKVLESRVDEAQVGYRQLEKDFPTGWKGNAESKVNNTSLAALLRRLQKDPEFSSVFGGRIDKSLPKGSSEILRKLAKDLTETSTGTAITSPAQVKKLGFREVQMLRRNLNALGAKKDIPGLQSYVDDLKDLMENTYGKRFKSVNDEWARSSQARDVFNIGTGKPKKFIGGTIADSGFFNQAELRTAEGLEEAVRKLRSQPRLGISVTKAEKDVLEQQLKDGIWVKFQRDLLSSNRDKANKTLSKIEPEWLRQFFPDDRKGERLFQEAMREVRSATPFGQKHRNLSRIMGAVALLGGARWAFGGGGPAGLLEAIAP